MAKGPPPGLPQAGRAPLAEHPRCPAVSKCAVCVTSLQPQLAGLTAQTSTARLVSRATRVPTSSYPHPPLTIDNLTYRGLEPSLSTVINEARAASSTAVEPTRVTVEPLDTDPDATLAASTIERIKRSIPANTRRAYERQWSQFLAWCQQNGRTVLPATPHTLADYVSHLADQHLSASSIEQAIAAVRTVHREAGYRGEPDTRLARRVLTSHKRDLAQAGRRKRQAPPVTINVLRAMVDATDADTLTGKRDRVLLVLGFAAMARRSELASLRIEDVSFTDDGLVVYIRQSKTDQEAAGVTVKIPAGVHPSTDPVRVVRAWLDALAEHSVTSGPLLRRINRWGQLQPGGMSPAAINERIRTLARNARLPDADSYTAHGLRAGGPTEAARAGFPVAHIARHGRWSLRSPQVHEYVREVDEWRDNPMRGIGL